MRFGNCQWTQSQLPILLFYLTGDICVRVRLASNIAQLQSLDAHDMQNAAKRIAFVVGNSAYRVEDYKLDSPTIDVDLMAASLERCDFVVQPHKDLTTGQLRKVFADFKGQAADADVALLYYSGHGLQLGDGNALLPIDTPTTLAGLLALEPVRIEGLIRETNDALKTRGGKCLVFLDACRSTPGTTASEGSAEQGKYVGLTGSTACTTCGLQVFPAGLSEIKVHRDSQTFIAYATSPGAVAEGVRNGPSRFTQRLGKYLATPGLPIDDLLRWVADAVSLDTNGAQRPWKHGNLIHAFAFRPPDWDPVKLMGLLGFIVGLLTASLSFHDDSYIPLAFGDVNSELIANLPFAALIAYGIMKWGRGTWRAGAVAFAITYLAWLAANFALAPVLAHKVVDCHESVRGFLFDRGLVLQLDAVFAAGVIYSVGILAAGAATSQSQRQIRPVAIAISVGFALVALYVVVALGMRAPHLIDCNRLDSSRFAVLLIHLAAGIWDGLLAAMSGYAYTAYVPAGWREADTELDRPAAAAIRHAEKRLCTAALRCWLRCRRAVRQ